MARFRFRFDPVLRQRRGAEDHCQRELAKVLRERLILQTQLGSMQQTITSSKHRLADGLVGAVDMARVGQFAGYSGQVTQRAHAIVMRMAKLEGQIDEARSKLLAASQARKSMELLMERDLRNWRLEQHRREEAELDELSTQQFVRRAAGEVGV
jgi:flagellar export protein FliJ